MEKKERDEFIKMFPGVGSWPERDQDYYLEWLRLKRAEDIARNRLAIRRFLAAMSKGVILTEEDRK